MKVLSFITSISQNCGGPSRSVPLLVKGLAEVGVEMTLMTFYSDDMNTHALDGTSARMKVLSKGATDKEIEEFLLSEDFDLIQMQSIWDPPYHQVAKIARKHHIPYIVTPRGMLEPWSLSQKKWKKKIALMLYQMRDQQKAACIFTTADMEAQHVRELGVRVPISVIPNGIETDGYPCRTSMEGIKKQILFLSRVHEKKGIEILIDAFAQLHDEFADWKVLIVGNGEMEYINSLKLKVKNLEMENCIEILPPVFGSDKIKLYQDSSLFCLPSYSENFGMVIAEAMSCGVPVMTTTYCPWEILNDTKTGWCIDLSVENLRLALREALSMSVDELYEKGQRASKLVFDNFNYKNVAQRTYELYKWVIEGGEKPSFVQL